MALENDQLAERVRNVTKAGLDEHNKRCRLYDRSYEIYRASGRMPDGTEPWQSKIRVKYAMYNIDTALVNIIGGAPRARVLPRSPDAVDQAKAMQSIMDYYADRANLASLQAPLALQALIFGATVAKTSWRYEERTQNRRVFSENPIDPTMPLDHGAQPQDVVIYDGPWIEPWDIYDCWWDPFARDVDSAAYVVLRSFVSKDYLLANQHLYSNLDELFKAGDATDRTQTAQDKRLESERRMDGRFELWEVWTDDRVIVLGNQRVVIRDDPNPHWHGRKPIVIANARPDLFKLQGIPETELIDHIQEAITSLKNMRMDNLKLTVMRGLTYREGGVPDPNMLTLRPRFKWPVSDHDDIMFQAPPPLPPEAYQEESSLLQQMETVTGISPYVTGNVPNSVSHTTATSVSLLQGAATRLLQFKAQQINNNCWQRAFEHWGADIKQFLSSPVDVRIPLPGGAYDWKKIGPADVAGEFDLRVIGADESSSKDQERQSAVQLLQALAPFMATGVINPKPLIEKVAQAFEFDNPEALIAQAPPPQQMAPMPNPQQQAPGQLQPPTMGGQQLPPEVMAAIQQGGMGG